MPHPSLPYFITYGIDSTAKLWRATIPVDESVDDTDLGRFSYDRKAKYEKSIIVDQWKSARRRAAVDLDDEDMCFFPEETPPFEEEIEDSMFGGFMGMLFARARSSQDGPFIGNDMMSLSKELGKNYFACARSDSEEEPVKSGLLGLKQRVSMLKLKHQSDRLGLSWNCKKPWIMRAQEHLLESLEESERSDGISYGAVADLIPDNPSDWIPFDEMLTNPPQAGGMQFNTKRYKAFYLQSYADHSITPTNRADVDDSDAFEQSTTAVGDGDGMRDQVEEEAAKQHHSIQSNEIIANSRPEQHDGEAQNDSYDASKSWDILYQTVMMLKNAGNEAMKASSFSLAARRYDKAIRYCSLAYMEVRN
jgi:hypothetical protein